MRNAEDEEGDDEDQPGDDVDEDHPERELGV
jgi:hypothetical protein